jgi:serine/threonine-protein kinase RsbW
MEPLTVAGTLESLSAIRAYVMAACASAGLDRKTAYRLSLAVDEIATNSVVYGYVPSKRDGDLRIIADIDTDTLRVTLEDSAPAYDPMQAPRPAALDIPLEQRQIGGLGIYLALRGVDHFAYERKGDLNRNIFIMKRPPAQAASA